MRSTRARLAEHAADLTTLKAELRRHPALTRVVGAALVLSVALAFSVQEPIHAGPDTRTTAAPAPSILPQSIGVGVATTAAVTIALDARLDPAAQSGVRVVPEQAVDVRWAAEGQRAIITAQDGWLPDQRYLVVVPTGESPAGDAVRRFSFTTQNAPRVMDFGVRLAGGDLPQIGAVAGADPVSFELAFLEDSPVPPSETASGVSASTTITVGFSEPMNRVDVEERFAITPEVAGELAWDGNDLVFRPSQRLTPGARYTVSLVGAHDARGNLLDGKANFSFTVRVGGQLVTTSPGLGETNVETDTVEMWFSQPMDTSTVDAAFSVVEAASGEAVAGTLDWNLEGTQLTFTPDSAFGAGRRFDISLGEGGTDVDGNPVVQGWSFTTKPAPVQVAAVRAGTTTRDAVATSSAATPVAVPAPAPGTGLEGYAVSQINASRAAYGFAPVALDNAISAVAYAHAYEQAVNGTLNHTSADGRTRDSRLRGGGIAFGWSGENQCYLVGRSVQATLDWCHVQFMVEPYPGHWNHIANVLSPNAGRVGVGIAQVGSRIVVVWNFTD